MRHLFLFLYFGGEAAAVELDGDRVAGGECGGGAEEVAGGVGGDSVAAFQDLQGAAFLELQRKALPAFTLCAKEAFGADAEIGAALFEAQAERRNLHAKIKRDDAEMLGGEAFPRLIEARAKAEGEPRSHFVGARVRLGPRV